MKRLFPEMNDRPDKGMFVAVILYGFMSFILMPVIVSMLGHGVWDELTVTSWMELVYHLLNAGVAAAMFKSYLGESFFNVQLYTKRFVKTVAVASLMMLTLALTFWFDLGIPFVDAYPINELSIALTGVSTALNNTVQGMVGQTIGSDIKLLSDSILSAACLIVALPLIGVYVAVQKHFTEGIERSGLVG